MQDDHEADEDQLSASARDTPLLNALARCTMEHFYVSIIAWRRTVTEAALGWAKEKRAEQETRADGEDAGAPSGSPPKPDRPWRDREYLCVPNGSEGRAKERRSTRRSGKSSVTKHEHPVESH